MRVENITKEFVSKLGEEDLDYLSDLIKTRVSRYVYGRKQKYLAENEYMLANAVVEVFQKSDGNNEQIQKIREQMKRGRMELTDKNKFSRNLRTEIYLDSKGASGNGGE